MFIGADSLVLSSAAELCTAVAEANSPAILLRNASFQLAGNADSTATTATVVETYQIYTAPRETMLYAAKQRATACFALDENGQWKAYHIHLSNEWSDPVDSDASPVKVSTETYEYVRTILRTGRKAGLLPSRIKLECGGSQRYANPDDILYIKADGEHCLVHCTDEMSHPL